MLLRAIQLFVHLVLCASCPSPLCLASKPPTCSALPTFFCAGVRLLRRVTGMKSATGDAVGRFMGRYTALMFATVLRVHEVLRPALGCGMTSGTKGGSAGGGAR